MIKKTSKFSKVFKKKKPQRNAYKAQRKKTSLKRRKKKNF